MLHLQPGQRLFISEDLIGYADKLDADGVFPRRLDLLLYGFAYAVANELEPAEDVQRHELIRAMYLDDEELPVSAVAQWYNRKLGHDPLDDEQDLLDFTCRVGIAGVRKLRERWEGRSKSQIQWDIMNKRSS
jgi:hypothetical protein